MSGNLDLRGLLCPEPVIATKKALDKPDCETVEVFVDDEICVSNLERLARSLKASFAVKAFDGFFEVTISKLNSTAVSQVDASVKSSAAKAVVDNKQTGSVVFLSKEGLGDGDVEFSKTLANVFLQTLFESGHRPRAILMANSGVRLMRADSPTRKVLEDFRTAGSEVFACGLCVDYYGLKSDVPKEQITNMFAICEYLTAAEKLIQF